MIFLFKTPGEYEVELGKGNYLFECWGANGGGEENGGKGGYSYGFCKIQSNTTFFVFVGGKGEQNGQNVEQKGGFNGGGNGGRGVSDTYSAGGGGGGASDIRIYNTSLSSRIIIAGGGGGGCGSGRESEPGGSGGGINGSSTSSIDGSNTTIVEGATQYSGHEEGQGENGRSAKDGSDFGACGSGGGGGGLYGGHASTNSGYGTQAGGGGGSGYLSGHKYCPQNSLFEFYRGDLINGDDLLNNDIIKPIEGGDGFVKITLITKQFYTQYCNNHFKMLIMYITLFALIKW